MTLSDLKILEVTANSVIYCIPVHVFTGTLSIQYQPCRNVLYLIVVFS